MVPIKEGRPPINAGNRNRKPKGLEKVKKTMFTHEHRILVCGLKMGGMEPKHISDAFYQKYSLQLPSSSLSTLYNDNGTKIYKELIKRGSLMNSVETQINRKQRPTMMIDLD